MTDTATLSSNITSSLQLGDHHYQDVRCIVEGKLRDRLDKLLGKKTRKGVPLTEEKISNTVKYAVENLLNSPIKNVLETAEHYRKKYDLAI